MYRIKNISLERIFQKYKKSRLQEFTEDELLDVCSELHITIEWVKDKRTNRIINMDKLPTIQNIHKALSFSEYMGELYWTPELKKEAQENEIFEKLAKHQSGEETFALMEGLGVGFYNLGPGQERIVNFSKRWIRDVLSQKPLYEFLQVENLDEDEEEDEDEVIEEQDLIPDLTEEIGAVGKKEEKIKYKDLAWGELRRIAAKKKVLKPKMNRVDVIEALNLLTNASTISNT